MSFYRQLYNNNLDRTKFYKGFTFFSELGYPVVFHANLMWEFVRLFIVEQGKIREGSSFYFIPHAKRSWQANFGTCIIF